MSKAKTSLLQQMRTELGELPNVRQNQAVFLALKPEIEETLAAGYTMKAIWQFLRDKDRVQMSYTTFRAHCKAAGLRRLTQVDRLAAQAGSRPGGALPSGGPQHQGAGPPRFGHSSEADPKLI